MKDKKSVTILMSTYNGEKYLDEQIQTILSQKDVQVEIFARDDGSSDNTINILEKYKINFITGKNLKSAFSFFELIEKCKMNSDYYAFSDQDDYWIDNKLIAGIKKIEESDLTKPILYFSSKNIVNDNLEFMYKLNEENNINIYNMMIKNCATGCTMIFNRKLLRYLKKYHPQYIDMHDSWVYRVCIAIDGIILNDSNSYINYRQHSNNVLGAKEKVINKIKRRAKSFFNPFHSREKIANELINGYQEYMSKENLNVINMFANYRKSFKDKIKILFDNRIRTSQFKENFLFKITILFNKF